MLLLSDVLGQFELCRVITAHLNVRSLASFGRVSSVAHRASKELFLCISWRICVVEDETILIYDVKANAWTSVCSLPGHFDDVCAVTCGDNMYVLGWQHGEPELTYFGTLDQGRKMLEHLTPPPLILDTNSQILSLDGWIYVLGEEEVAIPGTTWHGQQTRIARWHISSSWELMPQCPNGNFGRECKMVGVRGRLYFIEGDDRGDNKFVCYDPAVEQWRSLSLRNENIAEAFSDYPTVLALPHGIFVFRSRDVVATEHRAHHQQQRALEPLTRRDPLFPLVSYTMYSSWFYNCEGDTWRELAQMPHDPGRNPKIILLGHTCYTFGSFRHDRCIAGCNVREVSHWGQWGIYNPSDFRGHCYYVSLGDGSAFLALGGYSHSMPQNSVELFVPHLGAGGLWKRRASLPNMSPRRIRTACAAPVYGDTIFHFDAAMAQVEKNGQEVEDEEEGMDIEVDEEIHTFFDELDDREIATFLRTMGPPPTPAAG